MAAASQPLTADPSQHRQELTERLDSLRRLDSFCDVTIAVKGQEFKAHKVVLAAASPFFLSLLESNMRESNEQLIRIELEEATASVMEDVLKYVYTGNVSVTEESGHNLIATADYLLLPGLKTAACDFLKENVTIENCVFNYYFAKKYQCVELKETCCKVVNKNFRVVMETDDFLNLDMKGVMEWVSSDEVTISAEEDVFKGIVKWVTYNKSERESCFPDLLRQVRLMSVSQDFLLDVLIKEELITTNIDCANFVLGSMKSILDPTCENGLEPPRKCLKSHSSGILVCGGRKSLCYLPQYNTWYQLADMILEHQNHAVVQYCDRVYVLDEQRLRKSPVAEYYMCSSNSWAAMQTKFEYEEKISSLLALNGCMYALTDDNNNHENTLFIYHRKKNKWVIKKCNASECWGACGASDGHHIYIIGGTSKGAAEINGSSTVVRFDPSSDICEEVAAMNVARHDAFAAALNGKIYVAGGMQRCEQFCRVLNTCEMYEPSTDKWQLMPSLNVPRHSASMVCFEGALYVLGGLKDKHTRELSVEMYDFETSEWKKKSTIPVCNESLEERRKRYHFKACFTTMHKAVFDELTPR